MWFRKVVNANYKVTTRVYSSLCMCIVCTTDVAEQVFHKKVNNYNDRTINENRKEETTCAQLKYYNTTIFFILNFKILWNNTYSYRDTPIPKCSAV